MSLRASVNTPISRNTPHPFTAGKLPSRIRAAQRYADASDDLARMAEGFQRSLDALHNSARTASQSVKDIVVEDDDGRLVGHVGDWWVDGERYKGGQFVELRVGDAKGDRNPADAPFYATEDGRVVVGKNGSVAVRDPYDSDAAWIGTKWDTLDVTDAVDNGSGLIRLEIVGHPLLTDDSVLCDEVGGVPNARGQFAVTVVDVDHVDLQSSVFDGAYTSGGWVTRLLHVTGAADNGAGLIRLEVTAHGYETGDRASVADVGGVPNATGQWIVTVFDADHFDLQGSTWAGTYTSGGTCVRYFAGIDAQTFAIGGFKTYRLRAFSDGSLRIRDALITLTGSLATITLDPDLGRLLIVAGAMPNLRTMTLDNSGLAIMGYGTYLGSFAATTNSLRVGPTTGTQLIFNTTSVNGLQVVSNGAGYPLNLNSFGPATGAVAYLNSARGNFSSPTATQVNDIVGGFYARGYGAGSGYFASVLAVAQEAYGAGAGGTAVIVEATPSGSTIKAEVARFTSDGLALGTAVANKGVQITTTAASGAAAGSGLYLYTDDGAAIANGDRLGFLILGGERGDGTLQNSAAVAAFATEDWSATAAGSKVVVQTTANTTLTRSTRLEVSEAGIDVTGGIKVGGTAVVDSSRNAEFATAKIVGNVGFYNATPVAQQTLAAYTSNPQSSTYAGLASGVGGNPYAGWAELNTLRVAYENLRVMVEDLRAKVLATTLVA